MTICNICKNEKNNTSYTVREMMFGSREEFEYFQCHHCQCLQIKEIPANLSKYYPDNYYPYLLPKQLPFLSKKIKSFLRRCRHQFFISGKNVIGKLVSRYWGPPELWMKYLPEPDSAVRVLDVGSGTGANLIVLQELGFSSLNGVDPFIEKDVFYGDEFKILKQDLASTEGQFDFIMLHHSFEHMPEPATVIAHLARLLAPQGKILIRIPIIPCHAWETYGVHWFQLDAPRHLFIHSIKSIEHITKPHDLMISSIEYDSAETQFWVSEQYSKNIALNDKRSYSVSPANSLFSTEEIDDFKRQATELNQNQNGDQACIVLEEIC